MVLGIWVYFIILAEWRQETILTDISPFRVCLLLFVASEFYKFKTLQYVISTLSMYSIMNIQTTWHIPQQFHYTVKMNAHHYVQNSQNIQMLDLLFLLQ